MKGMEIAGIVIWTVIITACLISSYLRNNIAYQVFVLSDKGSVGMLAIWFTWICVIVALVMGIVTLAFTLAWIGNAVVSGFAFATGINLPMP